MAQKAAKALAARNTALLRRTHFTSLALHALLLALYFALHRPRSLATYALLTAPSLLIELYLDRVGRPRYDRPQSLSQQQQQQQPLVLRSPGEDLDARGLTEFLWDVLYWTWGVMGAVCLLGDRAWWAWVVVPVYAAYAAYSAVMGVRRGMAGMGFGMGDDGGAASGESKRQKKMEKKGQKMMYQ